MSDEDKPFTDTRTGQPLSALEVQARFDAHDRKQAREGPIKAGVFSIAILLSGFYGLAHPNIAPLIGSWFWDGQLVIGCIGIAMSLYGFRSRPK